MKKDHPDCSKVALRENEAGGATVSICAALDLRSDFKYSPAAAILRARAPVHGGSVQITRWVKRYSGERMVSISIKRPSEVI
jgi:hypothetical protein